MSLPHTRDLVSALSIDGLRLLLPHHEVNVLAPVADIAAVQKQDKVVGWFTAGTTKIPIYCLSCDLAVLDTISPVRRIAVIMVTDESAIGILCDDLKVLPCKQLITHPLPECMKMPGTPLTGLALHENTVFCLSSANHLQKYLRESPMLPDTGICA